jgi:hypothetical protein
MAGSRSGPKPKSDLKCRHCRAPNDIDAPECWLCQRRDWLGARGTRPRDEPPLPGRNPYATVAGLPGVDLRPRRQDGQKSGPTRPLFVFVLFAVIGAAWWLEKTHRNSPAADPIVAIIILIFLGLLLSERGRP